MNFVHAKNHGPYENQVGPYINHTIQGRNRMMNSCTIQTSSTSTACLPIQTGSSVNGLKIQTGSEQINKNVNKNSTPTLAPTKDITNTNTNNDRLGPIGAERVRTNHVSSITTIPSTTSDRLQSKKVLASLSNHMGPSSTSTSSTTIAVAAAAVAAAATAGGVSSAIVSDRFGFNPKVTPTSVAASPPAFLITSKDDKTHVSDNNSKRLNLNINFNSNKNHLGSTNSCGSSSDQTTFDSTALQHDNHDDDVICRYYLCGICRFGSNCRYSHASPLVKNHMNILNEKTNYLYPMVGAAAGTPLPPTPPSPAQLVPQLPLAPAITAIPPNPSSGATARLSPLNVSSSCNVHNGCGDSLNLFKKIPVNQEDTTHHHHHYQNHPHHHYKYCSDENFLNLNAFMPLNYSSYTNNCNPATTNNNIINSSSSSGGKSSNNNNNINNINTNINNNNMNNINNNMNNNTNNNSSSSRMNINNLNSCLNTFYKMNSSSNTLLNENSFIGDSNEMFYRKFDTNCCQQNLNSSCLNNNNSSSASIFNCSSNLLGGTAGGTIGNKSLNTSTLNNCNNSFGAGANNMSLNYSQITNNNNNSNNNNININNNNSNNSINNNNNISNISNNSSKNNSNISKNNNNISNPNSNSDPTATITNNGSNNIGIRNGNGTNESPNLFSVENNVNIINFQQHIQQITQCLQQGQFLQSLQQQHQQQQHHQAQVQAQAQLYQQNLQQHFAMNLAQNKNLDQPIHLFDSHAPLQQQKQQQQQQPQQQQQQQQQQNQQQQQDYQTVKPSKFMNLPHLEKQKKPLNQNRQQPAQSLSNQPSQSNQSNHSNYLNSHSHAHLPSHSRINKSLLGTNGNGTKVESNPGTALLPTPSFAAAAFKNNEAGCSSGTSSSNNVKTSGLICPILNGNFNVPININLPSCSTAVNNSNTNNTNNSNNNSSSNVNNIPSSLLALNASTSSAAGLSKELIDSIQVFETGSIFAFCPFEPPCPFGKHCAYVIHMQQCSMCDKFCLNPNDPEQRRQHHAECLKEHEQAMEYSFAIARSKDKICSICYDPVLKKSGREKRFGILPNCNHIFCLECIKKWRQEKNYELNRSIIRSCPMCRVSSDYVYPCAFWIENEDEKKKLLSEYRTALGRIDCKYFKKGEGKCPFGSKCFYKHALSNGELIDVDMQARLSNLYRRQ